MYWLFDKNSHFGKFYSKYAPVCQTEIRIMRLSPEIIDRPAVCMGSLIKGHQTRL
jgi:hypothetical protein